MGELREIGLTSLLDVPEKLRALADEIERRGKAVSCVVIVAEYQSEARVYGAGVRSTALECSGWLARAQAQIAATSEVYDLPSPPAA